jgi:hypothetical protein
MRAGAAWIVFAGSLAAGCGLSTTDPCDSADQALQSITAKSSGCTGVTLPPLKDTADCEAAIKNCNDAEKVVLNEELGCLINDVGTCTSINEQAWIESVATCAAPTATLSSTCRQGFGL